MLINKTVIIKWNSRIKKWYEEREYKFTKMGDEFEVKVEDLSDGSNALVDVECDGCGELLENIKWKTYLKYNVNDKYYCQKCAINGNKKWINFFEWCYLNLSKNEADRILARWDYELNIDKKGKKLSPKDVSYSSLGINSKGYWFKCLDHLKHGSEQKRINDFTMGCKGSILCNQCKTISTTNPELIKYLVNKEDAYKYSHGSNEKIPMKCPDCGCEKTIRPSTLKKYGFACPRCSDGISYPEKILFNVFEQLLDKGFQTQLSKATFKWCKNYRYDFYIHKINGICEVGGIQHYKETNSKWDSLKDIQENDKNKELLAKNNGIENYIILDCRKSELEWIKNSIMESELPNILNFTEDDIDWLKCHEFACSSLVKVVCDLWNSGIRNLSEIAYTLKLHSVSVRNYLKQGFKLGWCNYNSKIEAKDNLLKMSRNNCKKVICLTTGEIFDSMKQAGKKYNIKNPRSISLCAKDILKSSGKLSDGTKLVWKYYDEYLELHKSTKELSI